MPAHAQKRYRHIYIYIYTHRESRVHNHEHRAKALGNNTCTYMYPTSFILVNAEHYGASVREVADGTKNADSAGLNRFPIRPATFARSAAHAQ